MCSLERFKIDLKGLKDELTQLELDLDDAFFQALGATEVQGGTLHVSASIRKASGFFEFSFHTEGTVTVPCDRCLDDMQLPVSTDNELTAKLGGVASTGETDDVIVVDENEGVLDTAWLIYEFVALAIPIQHVHQPGDCNAAMIEKLNEHSTAARSSDGDGQQPTDPRWDALLKLKNNN